MALEIERKYLVEGPWPVPTAPGVRIRQAYLPQPTPQHDVVRVRLATYPDGTHQAWLTTKGPGTLVRRETEVHLRPATARALLARGDLPEVAKTRHELPLPDGLVLEVDVYEGALAGLVVAEVELPTADTAVALPPWVGREVTEDPAYTNAALARQGRPASPPRPRSP